MPNLVRREFNCAPSRAGSRSITFLEDRMIPCILRQSRIAARHSPGTRNSQGLTWNVGSSRAAPWFRDRKILSQGNLLCSVIPEMRANN